MKLKPTCGKEMDQLPLGIVCPHSGNLSIQVYVPVGTLHTRLPSLSPVYTPTQTLTLPT